MMFVRFPRSRILIFAKAPEPGRVKTRLIPAIGAHAASRLYERLVTRLLEEATGAALAPVVLYGAPDANHPFFAECAESYPVELRIQRGRDLGERMHLALAEALEEAESAVLVGTDAPAMDRAYLETALDMLAQGREVVFGPAEDGGYVLVGLRRPRPELFHDIPWGTARVMAKTREQLSALKLTWEELPLQWDLDRPEDLLRLRRSGWESLP